MAHSAYPELGDSAIHKLIGVLSDMQRIPLPVDELLGPSTLNIGTLSGGRAPNIIADEAKADIMVRLVGDSTTTKAALAQAVEGRAELREVIEIPALRLNAVDGIPTTVVAYTTDIPAFGGQWGEPFLIGPGTIHVAHTLEERVPKAQLLQAVELYQSIVRQLCKRESK
jgi:acetylornithine deacetylase